MSLSEWTQRRKEDAVTQVLDRPTTDVDRRTSTDVLTRPTTVEREEIRQLPPAGRPPRMFRWLGWLLGLAAVAALSWFVIAEITGDDAVSTPTYVVTEPGAIIADPKARTPVVTSEMIAEAVRTGQPGLVSLTEIVTRGSFARVNLEDATVNPMIYWAVPPSYATMMEEATVSPMIYWSSPPEPNWSLETYELISTYTPTPAEEVAPVILGPGNYDNFML